MKIIKEEVQELSEKTGWPKWYCRLLIWALSPSIERACEQLVSEQERFDEMHNAAHGINPPPAKLEE